MHQVFCILIVLFGKGSFPLSHTLLHFWGLHMCVYACVEFSTFFLLPLLPHFFVYVKHRQFPFFTEMSEMSLLYLQFSSSVSFRK